MPTTPGCPRHAGRRRPWPATVRWAGPESRTGGGTSRGSGCGPVARGVGQPPVGPGHPGQGGLHLRQAAQHPVIGGRGRQVAKAGTCQAPQTTAIRVEAIPDRAAQHLAHVRLTDRVARIGFPGVGAEDPDGLGQGIENRWSGDVLHHVLPPAFRVVVPGRGGQFPDGIGARHAGSRPAIASWCAGRQVAEPDRDARAQRVLNRLPLRREHREWPERRLLRLAGHVSEQRHRRPHLLIRRQRDQPVRLRRPLDQHDIGAPLRQGRSHRPRRPRPVMPDPVQDGRKILTPNGPLCVPRPSTALFIRRRRGRHGRSRSSHRVPARPSPGIPARPRGRRPGPARRRR